MADDKAGKGPDPKSLKEVNKELGFIEDALTSISVLLTQKIEEAFENIEDSTKTIADIYANNLEKSIKGMAKNSDAILKNTMAALSGELKVADVKKLQQKLRLQEEATERNIQKLKALGLIDDKKAEELQKDLTANIEHQNALLEEQLKIAKEQVSVGGKLKEALDKNFSSVKDQVTQFFSLTGIIGILINGIGKADKQVVAMSKSLSVSRDAAQEMRNGMENYSVNAKDSFVTVERLYKAQQGLSEQLGIAVDFSNEERENFARLTEQVGLTNEEAAGLAKNAAVTGKSTTEYLASVRNAAFEAQRANKIRISDKELLSTISKLSSGILVKFKGNTDALAKAVIQAKKLGVTLEQVDKIGDSMLDFEQSIEKELEAELITGKQLNFERARAAALTGDQATLMEEIASQAGSLEEFQNMNVVAQKSLAEAFGMSSDEMAEMLRKQEAINKYGDKASELNEQQIEEMERKGMNAEQYTQHLQEQRTIQEKFNDLITKLQEQLVGIVDGPLGKMLTTILEILGNSTGIKIVFAALGAYMAGSLFASLAKVGKLIKAQKADSMATAIISIVKGAWQSLGPIPFIGAALAAAAAGVGIAYLSSESSKKGDDVVSPGYGKRTLFSPEGSIALNDKDTVIAGTNLGGGGGNRGGGGGESMGMVVAAIKDLQNSINKLASRPITVSLDGEKVGTMVGRRNETGTEQVKNSYSLA
jgi:hypothetical protein